MKDCYITAQKAMKNILWAAENPERISEREDEG